MSDCLLYTNSGRDKGRDGTCTRVPRGCTDVVMVSNRTSPWDPGTQRKQVYRNPSSQLTEGAVVIKGQIRDVVRTRMHTNARTSMRYGKLADQ